MLSLNGIRHFMFESLDLNNNNANTGKDLNEIIKNNNLDDS